MGNFQTEPKRPRPSAEDCPELVLTDLGGRVIADPNAGFRTTSQFDRNRAHEAGRIARHQAQIVADAEEAAYKEEAYRQRAIERAGSTAISEVPPIKDAAVEQAIPGSQDPSQGGEMHETPPAAARQPIMMIRT